MQALRWYGRKDLRLEDIPEPSPGVGEVKIKVSLAGICGTDLKEYSAGPCIINGENAPVTIGHEFAGEIVEIGRNVEGLSLGQRCSGEGHLIGSDSRQSRAGKFHLDPGTRGIGVNEQGAFAQYLKLPAFNVVPLPDDIPAEPVLVEQGDGQLGSDLKLVATADQLPD